MKSSINAIKAYYFSFIWADSQMVLFCFSNNFHNVVQMLLANAPKPKQIYRGKL